MGDLCVGGPLHGRRIDAVPLGTLQHLLQSTMGGPEGERFIAHRYTLQKALLPSGRFVRAWRWQMIPRWTRAGFAKSKYHQ